MRKTIKIDSFGEIWFDLDFETIKSVREFSDYFKIDICDGLSDVLIPKDDMTYDEEKEFRNWCQNKGIEIVEFSK